jgi:hypothetical protein
MVSLMPLTVTIRVVRDHARAEELAVDDRTAVRTALDELRQQGVIEIGPADRLTLEGSSFELTSMRSGVRVVA